MGKAHVQEGGRKTTNIVRSTNLITKNCIIHFPLTEMKEKEITGYDQ